jgi:hypothetical protein
VPEQDADERALPLDRNLRDLRQRPVAAAIERLGVGTMASSAASSSGPGRAS